MSIHIPYFTKNYGRAFFIGCLVTNKILYVNQLAKEFFGVTPENCDFAKIFKRTEGEIRGIIQDSLKMGKPCLMYDFLAYKADGAMVMVDLHLGFYNEDKSEIFLELTPKNDSSIDMALHQINYSIRPEAMLNLDHKLSIVHCNDAFHAVFDSSQSLRYSHFKNDLINGFLPEMRKDLIADIHATLKNSDNFSTELQVFTAKGEEKWYRFELQKRIMSDSKVKLMCYMVNIEKEIKKEEEILLLNNYLKAIQSVSGESLYSVDVNTNVLRQTGEIATELGLPEEVFNFPEGVYSYIHIDDLERYKEFIGDVLKGIDGTIELKIKTAQEDYQWYEIAAVAIYSNDGNIIEIFGKLKNIHEEILIEKEYEEKTQYFEIMQGLSEDILYSVDNHMMLYHNLETEHKILKHKKVKECLNVFINEKIIHPDDVERYLLAQKNFEKVDVIEETFRFAFFNEEYQWYIVRAKKLYDDKGKIKEIIGRLINVEKEMVATNKLTIFNQYLETMKNISDESIYIFEFNTGLLHTGGLTEKELGLPRIINSYPKTVSHLVHPDDLEKFNSFTVHSLEINESRLEVRIKNIDGSYQWYELISNIIRNEEGNPTEILGKIKNVQSDHEIKEEYLHINQYFTAMQNMTDDILFHIDIKRKIFRHADKNGERFGASKEIHDFVEVFIQHEFIRPEDATMYREYVEKLMSGENIEYEIQAAVDVGVYEWFNIKSQFIYDEQWKPKEIFGMMKNIQELKDLEQKAAHDGLTAVQNIKTFEDKVRKELMEPKHSSCHALVIIDLDDFKYVNDTYGHQFGDFILKNFARRVKNCIRDTDMIGRLGGDEFVVYLKGIFYEDMAVERANIIFERLKPPIANDTYSHQQCASMGIALIPAEGITYETLYENADRAVYHSKRQGKNKVTVYSENISSDRIQK